MVMFGITLINRLQSWTQPLWLVLLVLPYAAVLWRHRPDRAMDHLRGLRAAGRAFSLIAFGQRRRSSSR
jgi:hypothetical protein